MQGNRYLNLYLPISLCIVTLAYFLTRYFEYSLFGFDPLHEGTILKPALDVADGQTPFKDTFLLYGIVHTWLHIPFVKLFGPELSSLRYATFFTHALCFASLFYWAHRFKNYWLLLISFLAIMPVLPQFHRSLPFMWPWSSVTALLVQSTIIGAFLASLRSQSRYPMLIAGFFSLVLFHVRQTNGFYLLATVLGLLVLRLLVLKVIKKKVRDSQEWKDLKHYFSGVLAGAFLISGILLAQGALKGWYEQNIEWVLSYAKGNSKTLDYVLWTCLMHNPLFFFTKLGVGLLLLFSAEFPKVRKFALFVFAAIVLENFVLRSLFLEYAVKSSKFFPGMFYIDYWFPAFSVALTLFGSWNLWKHKFEQKRWIMWVTNACVLGFWLQYVPSADPDHVFWSIYLMAPWFFFYLHFLNVLPRNLFAAVSLCFVLSNLSAIQSVQRGNVEHKRFVPVSDGILAGLRVEPEILRGWNKIEAEIAKCKAYFQTEVPIRNYTTTPFFSLLTTNYRNHVVSNWHWASLPIDLFDNGNLKTYAKEDFIAISGWWVSRGDEQWFARELRERDMIPCKKIVGFKFPYVGADQLWIWIPKRVAPGLGEVVAE